MHIEAVQNFVLKIMRELPEKWRKLLEKLFLLENFSEITKSLYAQAVLSFLEATKIKDPKNIEKKHVEKWYQHIKAKYAENTIHNYVNCMKKLLRVLYECEDTPPCISWIKTRRKNNNNMRDKLLTQEEIKALVDVAKDIKIKALIMVLYEGALRISEALSLRIRDVEFTRYGAKIRVNGKTGERTLILIKSEPYLREWLNVHPLKHDSNAYVFVSYYNGKWKQLSRVTAHIHLTRLAKKAGINKKVHPHMLRHTRLTELATKLTEQELKIIAGWKLDSKMPAIYVHLSGRDAEKALLKAEGIEVKEETKKEKSKLEPIVCPRCGYKNRFDAKYCSFCGLILDDKTALLFADKTVTQQLEQEEQAFLRDFEKMIKAMQLLAKTKPQVLKELVKAMQTVS